jgi:hypothetical protein
MAVNKSLFYKELSLKDSNKKIQALLKEKKTLVAKKHFQPGQLIFSSYNAKDKTKTYDKTPLALILKRGRKYTLVLNFHWIPLSMRLNLIRTIMLMNKRNIAEGKPLDFNYGDLKPMLKSLGYAPCIRKYINARMGRIGLSLPPERLGEVARLKGESFTNGRYSSSQLFRMARARGKASEKPKKR